MLFFPIYNEANEFKGSVSARDAKDALAIWAESHAEFSGDWSIDLGSEGKIWLCGRTKFLFTWLNGVEDPSVFDSTLAVVES